ncbi:MAG TPA: efflux RND transporter permease subunit [Bacillota bacterium]|nr:efflux RND transporter permease subunit [Bacillota bacterium]
MHLSEVSIRRPVAVLMLMLIVVLLGVVSYANLQMDLLPEITPPVAAIVTTFPGASATEVADLVTVPLETAAVTTSGIKDIMSISQEGVSIIVLTFDWGQDMVEARNDITQKLELVPLPEDASRPTVMKFDPTMLPVMQVAVTHLRDSAPGELTELANEVLKPRLEGVEGVAAVEVLGGLTRHVEVSLDPDKMSALGLTQDSIAALIAASNLNYPLGKLEENQLHLDLRLEGKFRSVEDLEDLVVGYAPSTLLGQLRSGRNSLSTNPDMASHPAGLAQAPSLPVAMVPVTLKDLASVKETLAEATSITRINGDPSVTLMIKKEGSANTVTVARALRAELKNLESEISGLSTLISFDQAEFIELAINSVSENLLQGAALAILILLVFLRDIRTTLVIAVSIPFSIVATFVLMYFGNLTLNVMTLGGLTLGVGMLVDNSIVVIENIYRHIEEGKSPKQASLDGAKQVATAITASTLTTIVVFLPVVFVGGISGIIFKELAWTVTLSLLASLIVALTVVPMLASKWFSRKLGAALGSRTPDTRQARYTGGYRRLVEWSLDNRILVFAVVAALIAGSYYLARDIGTEFLPTTDEGSFSISVSMPEGLPLESTDEIVSKIEDILERHESVAMYSVSIGQGDTLTFMRLSDNASAEILVAVTPEVMEDKSTQLVMEDVERQVNEIKGDAEVAFNLQSTLSMLAGGMEGSVEVSVSGPDIREVARLNDILVEKLKGVQGIKRVSSTLTERKPELHLVVDRQKAIAHGLTPAQVASAVSRAIRGQTVTRLEKDGTTFDVVVRYHKDSVKTIEDIGSLLLAGHSGTVPLKEIAQIVPGEGPISVYRIDQRLSASIRAQYSNRDLGSVTGEVSDLISSVDIPQGYAVEIGGMSQIMDESFEALKLAFVLAAILVYMVMAASFESLATPFVVLLTMPLGAIGVVAALYFSRHAFGITAFMGVIVLAGVIVNNGIVMVDFINQQRDAGVPLREAICDGATKRLRPVLMTSLTTILGLVPMALGWGEGAELAAPMALSLMGGLAAGTLLTLVLVPVVYSVFAGYKPEKAAGKATKGNS